jgi:undecaprenyl-diphosphatase
MLTVLQAILLGALQGVSELFPISSLGHSAIVPALLNWHIDESSNIFLIFVIATHFATALVLFFFFLKDWILIIKGFFRSLKNRFINLQDSYEKLAWLIIIATIPVGILGLLFEEKFKLIFSSAKIISLFLVGNGIMLYGAELLRKKAGENPANPDQEIAKISWWKGVKIGLAECLALLPGFSRTGSTLGAGLLAGLDHESSARFSFLLATPVIFAASALKLPELAVAGSGIWLPVTIGALFSALGAYFSVKFLTKYFQTKTLTPFSIYCIIAGLISLIILALR